MCDVDEEGVVNCVDARSIYDVPKVLFNEGLDAYIGGGGIIYLVKI